MKHCQITGVEMPDEINLENHACNTGDCDHYIQKDCDKTLAAYLDAQASDSSAEFPEAWGLAMDYCRKKGVTPASPTYEDFAAGLKVGFERGRSDRHVAVAKVKAAELSRWSSRILKLEKQLRESQAYSKGLEDTILKLTEAFDKAKNAKVICEDCGSALWRL